MSVQNEGLTPHSSEASVNTATAAANRLRAPKRSLAQPAVGTNTVIATRYTVMLAVRLSVDSPRLCAMAGSAVVTIVPSSVSMKNAAATISGIRRENVSAPPSAVTGDRTARF